MTKLEYTFKNDTLFKSLFVKYPELLKQLVADLLRISPESIEEFIITNPEIPPDHIGDKFCRLDINMIVNGRHVDIELQVRNEGDYPERTLYYWAREFSSSLGDGELYTELPRTVVISIMYFKQFGCDEYYSEYQALEVTRHTQLTDRLCLMFFELPKFTEVAEKEDSLKTWLSLFKAETEEDLQQIEALGVSVMEKTIEAYRQVTATDEFRNLERMRKDAHHNELAALANERRKTEEKYNVIIAKKDTEIEQQAAEIEQQASEIEQLKAELESYRKG